MYSSVTATANFTAFSTIVGTPSLSQSIIISGTGLSSGIIITVPAHFEISQNGASYSSTISLAPVNGNVSATTISVRYNPFAIGTHSGNLTIETLGLTTKSFALTGNAQAAWIAKDASTLYSNLAFTKVGIGTDNIPAGYNMAINGKIIARGLKIQASTWADHVFDKNYNLRSIESVANYIADNKHLPDVPSAKEVMENGVDMAEVNKVLLQKIEELTLYTIQLNERLKELEIKNVK